MMKMKKLFAASAAFVICLGLSACNENKSSKESEASSEAGSNDETSIAIPAKITVSPKSKLTEREYKGYYIANGITTGINLHAPEGLTVTDCETFENSDGTFTCMPECVPTASKPFVISDESGKDNMNFFASAGPGQEEFKKITKESYEEEYVKGVSDYFTDVEIKDFESFEIENYPALKAVIKAEYNGESFEQTQVVLDVAEFGCQSGYMYNITYTDYSGNLKDKIQDSIDSIDVCNALTLWRAYNNPDDAAAAQKNGEKISSDNKISNPKITTAVSAPKEAVTTVVITKSEKMESVMQYIEDIKTTKITIDEDARIKFNDIYN